MCSVHDGTDKGHTSKLDPDLKCILKFKIHVHSLYKSTSLSFSSDYAKGLLRSQYSRWHLLTYELINYRKVYNEGSVKGPKSDRE